MTNSLVQPSPSHLNAYSVARSAETTHQGYLRFHTGRHETLSSITGLLTVVR